MRFVFVAMTLSYATALAVAPSAPPNRSTVSTAIAFPSDADIRGLIKERVDDKRSAGIVVGILDSDGTRRVIAYGDAGPGKPPLDGDTVFEIGSVSKVFTATALAVLVQDGVVTLDDPVQKYLPAGVHVPMRSGKAITLANLSEQNSGLPPLPSNLHPKDPTNPYAGYSVRDLYAFLSSYTLTRDPGAQFEYSNLGVGLLGNALALATKTSYEALEGYRVWRPLGMTHTAITLTPWMVEHLARGHDETGLVVGNWDLPALAGAGAIRSTAADMLMFADANLHPERGLLQRAMAFAQTPRAPADADEKIGLNWLIDRPGKVTIVWHNGGTGGYRAFVGIDPSRKVGVVVLANTGGEASVDDIGMHLIDPTVPLAPKPKQHTAITLSASTLRQYVGSYALSPQFVMEVTLVGDTLHIRATGQDPLTLLPESQTEFFVKELDAQITFEHDATGAVSALVLHQGGQDQRARKTK